MCIRDSLFTDKIMSLAIPSKEMVEQYQTALKEMASYLEENFSTGLEEDYEDELTLEDFLDEMNKETKEDGEMDSDVDGMLMN